MEFEHLGEGFHKFILFVPYTGSSWGSFYNKLKNKSFLPTHFPPKNHPVEEKPVK